MAEFYVSSRGPFALAGGKLAMAVAKGHDVFCESRADARHVAQEFVGCGIYINSDFVYTGFHHLLKAFTQFRRIDVMLVLADTL